MRKIAEKITTVAMTKIDETFSRTWTAISDFDGARAGAAGARSRRRLADDLPAGADVVALAVPLATAATASS